jgi:hypothetical protein
MHNRAVARTRREAVRRYSIRTHSTQVDHGRTGAPVPPDGAEGLRRPDVVTSVIPHRVKAGASAPYETWLQEITPVVPRVPGGIRG